MSGLSLAPQVLGDERAPEVSRRVGSSGFPRGQGAAGRCSARRTALGAVLLVSVPGRWPEPSVWPPLSQR